MIGLGIFLGHCLGDFILQNDWMAAKKTKYTLPCLVHCLFYTLGMFLVLWPHFSLPWLFYLIVFATHFPIDRFRLARRMMTWTGQENFASGPFAPWSVIIVDNTMHLLIAYETACWLGVR